MEAVSPYTNRMILLPPALVHLKPDGHYSLLCADSVGGSQWAAPGDSTVEGRPQAVRAQGQRTQRRSLLGPEGPPLTEPPSGRSEKAAPGRSALRQETAACRDSLDRGLRS